MGQTSASTADALGRHTLQDHRDRHYRIRLASCTETVSLSGCEQLSPWNCGYHSWWRRAGSYPWHVAWVLAIHRVSHHTVVEWLYARLIPCPTEALSVVTSSIRKRS